MNERLNSYLIQGLEREDHLGTVVLRVHLLAEQGLDRIIGDHLPCPSRFLEGAQLSFASKLSLVDAMDVLPDWLIRALRRLNSVRNECVHDIDASVGRKHLEAIRLCLAEDRDGRPLPPGAGLDPGRHAGEILGKLLTSLRQRTPLWPTGTPGRSRRRKRSRTTGSRST